MSASSDVPSTQKPTHTANAWEEKDFRNVRFLENGKITNDRWSMKLIEEVAPIEVDTHIVACDGGGGALGHPRIYINLDEGVPRECIYCQLKYVYRKKK